MANIGGATIYEMLNIDDCISKQKCKVKSPYQNRSTLILDKISIVSLKLLSIVDIRLNQVKDKTNNDNAVLANLALIIIIGDFY